LYLKSYIQNGRDENKLSHVAEGYLLLSHFQRKEADRILLLDSAIVASRSFKSVYYPMVPYSDKGSYYKRIGRFDLAIDNYLKALELAKQNKVEYFIYATKYKIATIKSEIGRDKEALTIFKECLDYQNNKKKIDTNYYLDYIRSAAQSYSKINILDSAELYNNEGLKLTANKHKRLYDIFKINKGINLFRKKEYELAQKNLEEPLQVIDGDNISNVPYILRSHFYLGKINEKLKDSDKAAYHYIKVDSILQKSKLILPELRNGYKFLAAFNKEKNNSEKQLLYINRLLKFDSIIYNNRTLISDQLFEEYDTPALIEEKEELISKLENDKKSLGTGLISAMVLIALVLLLLLFQIRKAKKDRLRFEALMQEKDISVAKAKPKIIPKEQLDISQKIINDTLKSLDQFENEKGFLVKNLTVTQIAKKFGTNSKYLSRIINFYKQKSFSKYINDLRIEYTVALLKEDERLRKYTIQGIADDMGFNNAESFSTAFKKSTGIKPSYFIKKLNEIDT